MSSRQGKRYCVCVSCAGAAKLKSHSLTVGNGVECNACVRTPVASKSIWLIELAPTHNKLHNAHKPTEGKFWVGQSHCRRFCPILSAFVVVLSSSWESIAWQVAVAFLLNVAGPLCTSIGNTLAHYHFSLASSSLSALQVSVLTFSLLLNGVSSVTTNLAPTSIWPGRDFTPLTRQRLAALTLLALGATRQLVLTLHPFFLPFTTLQLLPIVPWCSFKFMIKITL